MEKLDKKNIEDILTLTPMQEGMLYHYLKDPGSDYYFEQLSLEIPGAVDFKFFEQAWNFVIQNNQMLRTVFRWDKVENPVQIILKQHPLNARYYVFPGKDSEKKEKWIEKIKTKDRNERFDLGEVPFRVTLCKINESKYEMIISNHHILYDGWSNGIILEEFFDAYNALCRGENPGKPGKTRFKEYVKWIQSRDREAGENSWRRYLMGLDSSVELSIKRSKGPGKITGSGNITVSIEKETGDQLKKFIHSHKITMATLFYSAWGMLLQRYNNCGDVLFGTTVSGRNAKIQGIEEMVGLFINTIPLRIKACPHETTMDLLYRVDNQLKARQEFEHTPLVKIREYSEIESRGELFDTIVVIESYPLSDRLKIEQGQLPVDSYSMQEMTHYDLTVGIVLLNGIEFIFTFQRGKFAEGAITRLANHYREIVEEILTHPDKETSRLEMITEEEKKRVLHDFNDTRMEYPLGKTIYQLFEEQAERTPNHIAVIGQSVGAIHESPLHLLPLQITYNELNQQSNQLALLLLAKGIRPDTIVAIMMERSVGMIIGILGILRAGGAYLPMDPEYPRERIDFMLKDSDAGILLKGNTVGAEKSEIRISKSRCIQTNPNDQNVNDKNSTATCCVLDFEYLNFEFVSNFEIRASDLNPSNLAYIIYTSGTTGKPKGVMIEHSSVLNRLFWVKERYRLNEKDVILQAASFIFDVSVCEMFRWIPPGGKLCLLPPGGEKNPGQIKETIAKHQVTTADFVPSVLRLILEDRDPQKTYNELSSLRWVFTGVEVVSLNLVNKFNETLNKFNKTRLINAYGPTESTVDVTYFDCTLIRKGNGEVVPIGKPMANVQVYILNRYGGIQPPGVYGELCIAGKGLARGYLNQPELTAEKFDHDLWDLWDYQDEKQKMPFGQIPLTINNSQLTINNSSLPSITPLPHHPIYHTGDLGRWLLDENIEFLGRKDYQVKIRGVRVELGEIENRLINHPAVKEVVVTARMDQNRDHFLCAYIVPSAPGSRVSDLQHYLHEKLPAVMVPDYFVLLEEIPLTHTGKVDRKSLPQPGIRAGINYIAPGNEIEKKLVEIWADILGGDRNSLRASPGSYPSIGIDDNFFQLGGHSLKAFILVSRIHKEFGVKIPLGEIFKTPTIRKLASCIREKEAGIYASIEPLEEREYYPLSSAQKRLFFLDKFEDSGTAYNMSAVFRIEGKVDKARFESTFNALIARHESLRTSFHLLDDKAVQRIHDEIVIGHWSLVIGEANRREIDGVIKDFVKPFDLSQAPLLRAGLWKLAEQEHLFLFDIHHIISDGMSIEILFDDFIRLYEGKKPPRQRIQYKDFTLWQNRLLETGQIKEQENYWLGTYPDSAEIPLLNLPTDFPRPAVFCFEGDCYEFKVEPGTGSRVKNFSSSVGATLYMTLMACLNILLHKYTGQEDIVVGSGIMGRRHGDLHHIVGMFVNSLALRNYPVNGKACLEFLKEVKKTGIQAFENQDVQFEHLVEQLNPPRNPSRNPIFDVLIVVQNFEPSKREIKAPWFIPYPLENKISKFDFTLFVNEIEDEIFFNIEYCSALFKKATIRRMAVHFLNILRQMVKEPGIQIGEMEILTPGEKQQLLIDFNETAAKYPLDNTIHQLFENRARQHPDNIAVVGPLRMKYRTYMTYMTYITYRELNKKSNQLAHLLRERGVKPDTIVGLMMERSMEMIVGILGILKAGGAYMPIDPDYPKERIDYMLADSNARVLLAGPDFAPTFEPLSSTLTLTSTCQVSPTNLAYIIYTSGSAGKPKGVMVEHASVVNVLYALHNEYPFRGSDVYLLKTSIVFDVSVIELFDWFLGGGRLAILETGGEKDPTKILHAIETQGITHVNFVPSVFNAFIEVLNEKNIGKLFSLKYIFLAGETLLPGLVDKFRRLNTNAALENLYGPTEGTVYSSKYSLYEWEGSGNIPIGKPLPNVRLYILDIYDHLQPIGVPGELCISGAGAARGYLNNPELTFEKFDRDLWDYQDYQDGYHRSDRSYKSYISNKLYRTGDLARWLPDGNIEFLGRIDNQVKIRGFRIEPGEIETQILDHSDVKEAVVVSREDKKGDKYLCAYIVPTSPGAFEKTPGITELSRFLSGRLPDYMVPSYFIELEKISLTGSGKVDRKALPEPGLKTGDNYAPPQNEIEEKLVKIWSEVLGAGHLSIGIHDNFFAAGGHSLKATILAARIHQTFNIKISLAEIFKTPTIAGLARYIASAEKSIYDSIQPVEEKEYHALSSSQQRFYVIQRLAPGDLGYNLSQVVSLDKGVDKEKLEQTFKQLIHRHESLRTSFENIDGQPVQRVHQEVEFEIEYYDMKEVEVKVEEGEGTRGLAPLSIGPAAQNPQLAASLIRNFVRPFDLSYAPLLRVGLVKKRDGNYLLLIDMHHIISDGTSQAVLTRDFVSLYEGKKLPLPRLQYKDFSQWQNNLVWSGKVKKHENYWLDRLKGPLPVLKLPIDFPRPESRSVKGAYHSVTLGEALTREMNRFIGETGTTLYMLLLAAFNIILSRYGGQQDIIIGSPIAGRYHADLEDIIGLVIGSIMMRNFPHPLKNFNAFMEEVKSNTLEAYEHQAYPFEELLKKVDWQEEPGHDPICNAALIVQNMAAPTAPINLPGGSRDHDSKTNDSSYYSYFPATSKLDITLYVVELEKDISLTFEYCTALFRPQTIERMAGHLETLLDRVINNPGMALWEIDIISTEEKRTVIGTDTRCYPLTHPQKRIYYTEKTYPHTGCNSVAFTVRYREILDRSLLEAAIQNVILKNDALRIRIVEFDFLPEPYQYAAPYRRQPLDYLDFRGRKKKGEEDLQKWIDKKTREPFSFINETLFYFALVRFNDKESGYYMKLHHIVSDGWTVFLLSRQVDIIYRELKAGRNVEETPYPSYFDYIRDEKNYLRSPGKEKDKEFWHKTLLPLPVAIDLSTKKGKPVNAAARAMKLPFPGDLRTRMHEYSKNNRTSLYKLVFSALSIYISRAANCDDVVIGGAGSNRSNGHQKRTAGMFVSTILFRVKVEEDMDFNCFVEKVGKDINLILKNQKYPYDLLLSELREKTGTDPGYLLNVNLIGHGDLKESRYKFDHHFPGDEPTPLCIHINVDNKDINGLLELEWDFQEERFTAADIRQMHRALVNILTDALANSQKKLPYIELLTQEEKEQILYDFNDTAAGYREDKIIYRLFEEQAEKSPDNISLVGTKLQNTNYKLQTNHKSQITNYKQSGMHLTYNELNEKSDRLAHVLKEKGVKPDTVAGLMVERSLEMIVGILGILKSGAAYLPIDTDYPKERIDYMLADSNTKVLLAAPDLASAFEPPSSTLTSTSTCQVSPTNLAYIIYTSGSTGRPKGVAVEHRNLMAYIHAFEKEFSPGAEDIVIQQASYCFDAFVEEMYPIMLKGGKLAVPPKGTVKDINLLGRFIFRHRVTLITCSPLLLNELNKLEPISPISSIHTFISGGDILKGEYIDNLLKTGKVYNTYGPTEATVCATYYRCPGGCPPYVPIGKPIVNYNVYVLDKHKQLLPVGIPGELCISGAGTARGYLNNPGLTSEKFLSLFYRSYKSYKSYISKRIYRTGDLARWLPDGNIEFLGRIDDQVNIRGYRIEPGEIQSRLSEHENIKEAVVIGRKDKEGDAYLCAYIIPHEEMKMSQLRQYLSNQLPAYMMPSYFVPIEKIPLTHNGKVDRDALPEPGLIPGETCTAPRSDVERKLAEVWSRVLGRDAVIASPGKLPSAISIDANFFDIGGHSLKATRLVSQIQEEFQVNVPLAEIFKRPTIKGLAEYIKEAKKEIYPTIEASEEREYYALSSAQRRLYITQQMEMDNISYNMPTVLQLEGELAKGKLEEVFKQLIKRHESFRTCFETVNETPVQKIHEDVKFEIENDRSLVNGPQSLVNCQGRGEVPSPITVEKIIRDFIRPFDLLRVPLLRVGLIKLKETIHILMLDMHHIISDGISTHIFVKELMSLYTGEDLGPLQFRYKDYSQWQNKRKHGESIKQQENYWLKQFGNQGDIPVLNLAGDYARPAIKSIEGNRVSFQVGKEDTGALKALALKENVTLYMLLFSIYNVLLSKLSGQEDIIVGTPTSGRRYAHLQEVIGMFVNTLALRNYPGGEKIFKVFLGEVKERALAAFDNQDYQYDDLVERLSAKGSVPRDVGRNPLFDVMFALQDMERTGLEIPGLKIKHCEYKSIMQTAKFDLTLVGYESGQTLFFTFEYRTTLYKKETIERFSRYFQELASTIPGALERKIADIEIIPGKERGRILYEFNDTTADYPTGKTIHGMIKEQVEKNPDNVALHGCMAAWLHGGIHITYCELNERSNQLAYLLKEKGVQPDGIVGIMVERSIEMVVGMLGILKAGSAYLPLDPEYPEERINFMLADSGANILLTEKELTDWFSSLPKAFLNLSEGRLSNSHHSSKNRINHHSKSLAYLIYTSGSTGKPKGVMVEHGSLVNLCYWHNRYFGVMEADRASQYAGIGFDASVWELFPYLARGVPLHIISSQVKYDIKAVNAYFERHHITIAFLPTPVCEQFMEFENCSLRLLLTGGDKLRTLKKRNYDLYNNYGPTENTVVTSSCPVEHYRDNIPIGKPIHNNQVYILNRDGMHLQPIGVPGELCIAGRGLARGYLNDPGLTNSKFQIPNKEVAFGQFNQKLLRGGPDASRGSFLEKSPPGRRRQNIYRTGDLARWLPDGNIEFLGRMDSQVKIRGSRIELGEIESQLLTHDGVKEAVVITVIHEGTRAVTGSRGELCAYIVPNVLHLSIRELREYLRGKLPGFMIPLYFVKLEKMPLTPGGKVDRNALPVPTWADIRDADEAPKAPGTGIEKRLAAAWQEVLGIEGIGIDDDFFEIGGDSIKAIQVSARLLKYGLKMEIGDLLANPTIKQLGQCIKRSDNCRVPEQGIVEGKVPLTPIQKWFFGNNFTRGHHFNQSVMIYREVGFDESFLRQLFAKIVTHHDALRMVYREEENGIVQWNRGLEGPLFDLKIMDLKDSIDIAAEIENAANKIQRAIDLETGPLVRLGLFRTLDGDHLLIVIHHLVVDGVSWRILLEDTAAGYSQLEKGEKIVLQEKTDSFRYWSQKLVEFSESKTLLKELEYWLAVEETGICHLPEDFEKTVEKEKNNAANSEIVTMNLDEEHTGTLLKEVNQAYNTEINDILLTALGMAVKEWTGIEKVVINLEGHGRESIIAGVDITRTIGWFTSQFPVVLDMSQWEDLSSKIKFVKETLRKIPDKGIGYGILRYLTPSEKRKGLILGMEPGISFNYLGQFDRGNRDGIFKISAMKMGDTVSPQSERTHTLNISGIITGGKLTLIFNYNKYEYKRVTIEKLIDGFRTHLLKIIHHCAQKEDRELTPVDMKYSKLTIEKLEELEDRVSGIDFD